ncbi:ATP-binding protein [Chromatiaceae bacterium AAb-1]|nr:ATP-binding protein [Chromatiaceae bacterium AAb-1]
MRIRLWLYFITAYLLLQLLLYIAGHHWLINKLLEQASSQSQHLAAFIHTEIKRLAPAAEQIAASSHLKNLLTQQESQQSSINAYLKEIQQVTGAEDIYLMDNQGLVLGSSNYQTPVSFVGKNFHFRPYTQQALSGTIGAYYALGTTSNRRGYYYSAPVFNDHKQVIAVIAVKIDLEPIEKQQQTIAGLSGNHFMVTGESNDIFLSDLKEWRLTLLNNPDMIVSDQERYLGITFPVTQLTSHTFWFAPDQTFWTLATKEREINVLPYITPLSEFGWQLIMLLEYRKYMQTVWWLMAFGTLIYIGTILALMFRRERQKRLSQLIEHRALLEQRVIARTEELAETNQRLLRQIAQREQTESELAQTEQELVQAAKLATIGSLAASINHEINQPLTALQSYSQNTLKMLEKGLYRDAEANINNMQQLIQRLGNIVSQFKDFSRKSNGKNHPVSVSKLINEACGIVAHQCEQQNVTLRLRLPEQELLVLADTIQLEQVLVNILTNGLHAMNKMVHTAPFFAISVNASEDKVAIHIRDNGPGIEPHHLEKIFEAFFTTKQRDGLGLGLSISRRIVQSFGGNIQVKNHPQQGAEFIVTLPRYRHITDIQEQTHG